MLNKFIPLVAVRYFKAKKNEKFVSVISALSLFGVMLGVAALIIVMSVMKGFHREFAKNIIGLNGDINVISYSGSINDYKDVVDIIKKQQNIKVVTPSVIGQALAIGNINNSGALVRGIDKDDLLNKEEIVQGIIVGSIDHFYGNHVIAIGKELADTLGVKVGEKIKLISPNTVSTVMGSMPRSKEFEVICIFTSGRYDYDVSTILMPLGAAQKFLSIGDNINVIEVNSTNPNNAELYGEELDKILPEDLHSVSWEKTNMQFLNAIAIERVAMFTILSLIIIVAAFNIISSLFMLVKDKTKDIAILRTIGATKKDIMLIFIYNGMIIGIIGTIAGVILGSLFAANINNIRKLLEKMTGVKIFDAMIYFLYSLPSEVHVEDVVKVASFALLLCFLATIYPAYKAAKLDPVEAMRYE